ncbi:MAG: iron ABC transporter permease [Desulfurococcales archaeon]|nr:iron ABC transporter permease [Desulfurococcales archaeon]
MNAGDAANRDWRLSDRTLFYGVAYGVTIIVGFLYIYGLVPYGITLIIAFLSGLFLSLYRCNKTKTRPADFYRFDANKQVYLIALLIIVIGLPLKIYGRGTFYLLEIISLTYATDVTIGLVDHTFVSIKNYHVKRREEKRIWEEYGLRSVPWIKRIDKLIAVFATYPLIMMTVFLLVPVTIVIVKAFTPPTVGPSAGDHLYWLKMVFTDPIYVREKPIGQFIATKIVDGMPVLYLGGARVTYNHGILINSLLVAVTVTISATLLGLLMAFIMARYKFPGKSLFRILVLVPMFIIPFANALAVKAIFSYDGIGSVILHDYLKILPWRINLAGLAGVIFLQIMAYMPIAYLNIFSSLANIDPNLEEQAENLGAKGFKLFRTVTLPLALPGIAAGAILVFIFSLEDLAGPIVFNERNLISYQIYDKLLVSAGKPTILPEISTLALVMLMFAILGYAIIRSYVSLKQYAMLSKGGRRHPRERKPGIAGLFSIYVVLLSILAFASVPQVGTILITFGLLQPDGKPTLSQFTLQHLERVLTAPDVNIYIRNSIVYASLALALMLTIAIPAAYAVSRSRSKLMNILDALVTLPIAIPGLVVAVGLFFFYSTGIFRGTPFDPTSPETYNPMYVLVLAYGIRKIPFVARSLFAGLQQTHVSLEEAAMNLGASRSKVLISIVIPLILLNILSGVLLGFIYASTEVSVSITLGGMSADNTKAPLTWFMKQTSLASVQASFDLVSLGFVLIIIQLIAVVIIVLGLRQSYAFISL